MLLYKTERIRREWEEGMPLRPLRFITLEIMGFCEWMWGYDSTITCIFRTEKEEQAVEAKSRTHKDLRADDLSVYKYERGPNGIARPVFDKDGERIRIYTSAHTKAIKYHVESILSANQTIVYVKDHGTAPHIHVQIPRNAQFNLKFR